MIPYLTTTEYKGGHINQISQVLPKQGIERTIIDAINALFDDPNLGNYTKELHEDFYSIIVYTDDKISLEDLRKLEHDSKCKVKFKNGMHGSIFFFTPHLEQDMNPSER